MLLLFRDRSHNTRLVLGRLLAAAAAARLALLAGHGTTSLLLADDAANILGALEGQALTLHLKDLGIGEAGRRDDAVGGASAAGAGNGAGVVVEGIAAEEHEVVVGDVGRGALLSIRLGERVTSGP